MNNIVFHRWLWMSVLQLCGLWYMNSKGWVVSLWRHDELGLGAVVLVIYTVTTLFIGYLSFKSTPYRTRRHMPVCVLTSNFLMALGMIASLIGLVIILKSQIGGIDVANSEAMRTALLHLTDSLGSAYNTTVIGLIAAFLLKYQLANLAYSLDSDDEGDSDEE